MFYQKPGMLTRPRVTRPRPYTTWSRPRPETPRPKWQGQGQGRTSQGIRRFFSL